MKLRHPFWLAAPLLLLAGCHSTGKAPVTSPRPVTAISIPLNNLTPEGWQFPGRITANSQRLSVDWDGDAAELLSQLAHRRGLTLRMTGVRLLFRSPSMNRTSRLRHSCVWFRFRSTGGRRWSRQPRLWKSPFCRP